MAQLRMPSHVTIRALGKPGDLGWVVMAHGELYAAEFGWDTTFETLVAQIVADFAATRDRTSPGDDDNPAPPAGWVAELDGERAGCVFCVGDDAPNIARLRLLLVDPRARGMQLGSRLVRTAIEAASAAGYERMQLWTNHPLLAARRIYLKHGFTLTAEEPHHSFGADLIGQSYELNLIR